MKSLSLTLPVVFILTLAAPELFAQEMNQMSDDDAKMMMEYQKMMMPGENQQRLGYFIGNWDVTVKSWMNGPGTEPMESSGTVAYTWTFDNRYIHESIHGDMMGSPYLSEGYLGYDNYRKQYVACSVNNMGTGVETMSGVYDAENNAYVFYGQMNDPMTGEIGKTVKWVMRIQDQIHWTGEAHDTAFGLGETKVMEIHCTRK